MPNKKLFILLPVAVLVVVFFFGATAMVVGPVLLQCHKCEGHINILLDRNRMDVRTRTSMH